MFSLMIDKITRSDVYLGQKKEHNFFLAFCIRTLKCTFFSFIWSSYIISGPVFIRPSDITNREQLIVTTKATYEREVLKCDGSNREISLENIKGKCSVLSLKHYCSCKSTLFSFLNKIWT